MAAASLKNKRKVVKAKQELKDIVSLNDKPWRWRVGIEAAFAMGIPLLTVYFLGNQTMGFIAGLGALTALHCPQLSRKERLVVLPLILLCITASAALGAYMAGAVWLKMLCVLLVTILGSIFMLGYRLGPPGPLMMVLVAAVVGKIASTPIPDTEGMPTIMYPALVGFGSVIAYLVVVISTLLFKEKKQRDTTDKRFSELFSGLKFDETSKGITIRTVAGVTIAVLMAWVFKEERIYWIVLPVIAILQVSYSVRLTVVKAIHRMGGSLLGVVLYGLILMVNPQGLGFIFTVLLLQFAIEVVVMRHYALALMFITPLALSITSIGHKGDMIVTVNTRIIDTLIGVAISLLVFFVFEKTKFKTK